MTKENALLSLIADLYQQMETAQARAEKAEAKLAEQDEETPTP